MSQSEKLVTCVQCGAVVPDAKAMWRREGLTCAPYCVACSQNESLNRVLGYRTVTVKGWRLKLAIIGVPKPYRVEITRQEAAK